MAKIHRRTVQNDLRDPDNHNGVIIHLEPDILECEIKGALESITTNKDSGGDGIPAERLIDDAVKVLHSICQQIWKTQRGHRTGKGHFSFQSPKKAMPKNAQTTAQLLSSHMLVWRRQWRPTPVLVPGKSHGWRSLVGCGPWGR